MVHPALGRLIFLLEPDGVRLRWLTYPYEEARGLQADNSVVELASRRGPEQLPLRPGAWNVLTLTLAGTKVVLQLNDVTVCERELEPNLEPAFGLYHDRSRTMARVRKVVLHGNWPATLTPEQLAQPLRLAGPPASPAVRRAFHALTGETLLLQNAAHVLRQLQDRPPGERYAALRAWVLPSDLHPTFRLASTFTPTDPAPPAAVQRTQSGYRSEPTAEPSEGGRRHTGSTLRAPAQELVALAQQLNQLEDLAAAVGKVPAAAPPERRGQLALQVLIHLAGQRVDEAANALNQLAAEWPKVPADAAEETFWPELLAATEAVNRPTLRPTALALLEGLNRRMAVRAFATDFAKQVRCQFERGQWLTQPQAEQLPWGVAPRLVHWAPVTHASAASRAAGLPAAHWAVRDGTLRHYAGGLDDALYFAVPLRGDFTVQCELSAPELRSPRLSYGGLGLEFQPDGRRCTIRHHTRVVRSVVLNPPLEKGKPWLAYRLVVQDGVATAYVDERCIYTERLPTEADPWLVVAQAGWCGGGVRLFRLSGSPTIPDNLDLCRPAGLHGWLAHYYDEFTTAPLSPPSAPGAGTPTSPAWEKRGQVIYGRATPEGPGSKRESLLQYHRPLLEDGTVRYEFFYEPGRSVTHPALDRLTFLLEPDGIKVHWLTDAPHETTGLAPDNATVEPANRRGPATLPLRPRDWNQVELTLAGSRVTLRLNGVEVYQRLLESTNQRIFGLFHYADENAVRVRHVSYRGQWPRQLPAADQVLAERGPPASGR
jgi:hypothetical protein